MEPSRIIFPGVDKERKNYYSCIQPSGRGRSFTLIANDSQEVKLIPLGQAAKNNFRHDFPNAHDAFIDFEEKVDANFLKGIKEIYSPDLQMAVVY